MEIVNIHKAKTNLSALIERAMKGEKIVIARKGKPMVSLTKIKSLKKERTPDKFAGKISIAPDFDVLPPEFDEYLR